MKKKVEAVSKLTELQHYLKINIGIKIEHIWLRSYCKKKTFCSFKKTRLIPEKILSVEVQRAFISILVCLFERPQMTKI